MIKLKASTERRKKMDKFMKCLALLVFLVAPSCCLAGRVSPPAIEPTYTLHMRDKDIKNLTIWCECPMINEITKDGKLQPGWDTKFSIHPNLFYDCNFEWESRRKLLVVYQGNMLDDCVGRYSKQCIWEARKDGFWFYNVNKHWVKKSDW